MSPGSGYPGAKWQGRHPSEVVRVGHQLRGAANEDAPARVVLRVGGVDLERHRLRTPRGIELRTSSRAEDDAPAVVDVVDREHDRLAAVHDRDPTEMMRAEQPRALDRVEHLHPVAYLADHDLIIGPGSRRGQGPKLPPAGTFGPNRGVARPATLPIGMLIYDFVTVVREFEAARAQFLARNAGRDGVIAAAAVPAPEATLVVGDARERDDSVVLPIAWSALSPGLFATLDGDLELAPLSGTLTHLSLQGSCRPLPAPPGRRDDERAARRATEGCVRGFLAALAATLELPAVPTPDGRR